MKKIEYTHQKSDNFILPSYITNNYSESKILFFDIETTGLSASNSTLYLIGALWYDDNFIQMRQWFNDDGYSEKELIETFNDFCKSYSCLIHFNGSTFDVPYIRHKAANYNLKIQNIDHLNQIDIYKEIRSYKNILGVENVKQVTIEKYIGLIRQDTKSGGELINVYQRYVARPDSEKEHLLLLHNHDDLLGMPAISTILNYKTLFEAPELIVKTINYASDEQKIQIDFVLAQHLNIPKRLLHTDKNGVFMNISDNTGSVIIPVIKTNLKHYFKDYKNYYYLPGEDMAIHKSVASYVEPQNREKATRENCYIIKEDSFIICPDKDHSEVFKTDHKDKRLYITCDSLMSADEEEKNEYVKNLIKTMR